MRRDYSLAVILLTSAAFAQTARVNPSRQAGLDLQTEGDIVAKSELARELAPDKDHPLPRKVISVQEGELSCVPAPRKVLVAHYRAEPTSRLSMNDDRIVIAVKQEDEFKILKVLDSDTVVVDGKLDSDTDFEEKFIDINAMHFLYIQTTVSGSGGIVENDVYGISSDQRLSIIPFQDVSESKILREGEGLRNGAYRFADGVFTFESGIYEAQDGECCPSLGTYHAQFRLEGQFKQDAHTRAYEPDFRFVVANEWRGKDR